MGRGKTKDASEMWERYAKLTDKDLPVSVATGIPKTTLSSYKVQRRFPRGDELFGIARALGVTTEYLITGQSPSIDPWALSHQDFINDIKILPAEQQAFIINAAKGEADRIRALQNTSVIDSAPST